MAWCPAQAETAACACRAEQASAGRERRWGRSWAARGFKGRTPLTEAVRRWNGSKHFSDKRKVLLASAIRQNRRAAARRQSPRDPRLGHRRPPYRRSQPLTISLSSEVSRSVAEAAHPSLFGQNPDHNLWLFSIIIKRNKEGDCEERSRVFICCCAGSVDFNPYRRPCGRRRQAMQRLSRHPVRRRIVLSKKVRTMLHHRHVRHLRESAENLPEDFPARLRLRW